MLGLPSSLKKKCDKKLVLDFEKVTNKNKNFKVKNEFKLLIIEFEILL